MAAAFVPLLHGSALLDATGDFVLLVYLLALGRFFLMLGGIDGGSSFGGMGASREALVSTLAEAPFLLALVSVAIAARSSKRRKRRALDSRLSVPDVEAIHDHPRDGEGK